MTDPALNARASQATPDAVPGNWVTRAPAFIRPYLRLVRADRPVGTWLLLIPCFWGLALAAAAGHSSWVLLWYAALFVIGAFVMRGAGCAYNDIVDRDIDAQVARTASRPIPAGEVSVKQAWALLVALSLTGLVVLLQFNRFTIFLGVASLALVAAYPFMKRITWWPQAWLGLTFNWGALVGYAAVVGELRAEALALYAAGICWTLFYDTIYAHQDVEDDALIGVKSSARRLGEKTKPALWLFVTGVLLLFALAGAVMGASLVYYLALTPAALHFFWQVRGLDIHDGGSCLKIFKSNRDSGLLLLLSPICELALRLT
ncbi:MAG: 4-hydroxybenzoate octaprenyltransferase [Pseudomonadota bacterium]